NGPSPESVRQTAKHRRKEELHQRVAGDQKTDIARRSIERRRVGVIRQYRNDHAKTDKVNKDSNENDDQRRGKKPFVSCLGWHFFETGLGGIYREVGSIIRRTPTRRRRSFR